MIILISFLLFANVPDTMNSSEWHSQLWSGLKNQFCGKDSFYETCYDFSNETCLVTFNKSFQKCSATSSKQKVIYYSSEGPTIARKISTCMSQEITSNGKEKKIDVCANRNKWVLK